MDVEVFEEMKRYIGFDEGDVRALKSLEPTVAPHLDGVVDSFYEVAARHPSAMAAFEGGDAQVAQQRKELHRWLTTLFAGEYGPDYFATRCRIGQTHVRVGLAQHYMVTGCEVIRSGLADVIRLASVSDAESKIRSVNKLLALDLGVMLESYKMSYIERVQAREREAMEHKLTRAEHLAEIGQLAASLAHEIKNPLAGISGAIQIIREHFGADHPHSAILGDVMTQINRLDAVVKDLLVYARPSDPRFESCNVDVIVRRILTVLREEPTVQKVPIHYAGNDRVPKIQADEAKIEQLVMNLVLNAAQACVGGGGVTVTTAVHDSKVSLVVSDTGQGLDATVRERAFEPFFTSKAKGTGLGLPICQSIVEAHKGSISLESEVGCGTRAIVELPRRRGGVT